jgi:hypothetical protein
VIPIATQQDPARLPLRATVFILALQSFACLLGQFYELWSMRTFACTVLPLATVLLIVIAYRWRGHRGPASPYTWIVLGALGGFVAALAYDAYRVPFVLQGAPLFKVFPKFGALILGTDEPVWLTQIVGWSYHFSNGAALGIMLLAMVTRPSRSSLLWCAVAWALFIEAMLLLTPYTAFFGLAMSGRFIFLTASAHLVFGVALGLWLRWRMPVPATERFG